MNRLKKLYAEFQKLSRRRKTYTILISLVILIMAWAFISAGIITGTFSRAQIKGGADEQKVNAEGIIITETKEGVKYFELYGERGNYNNTDKVAILHNVIGNFYKNNEVSMSFQSSRGQYDEKNRVITLFENTYIVMQDETSLEADKLIWAGSDKETVAAGNVKIKKGNDMIATADKCIISAGYDKFKIVGKTKTQVFGKGKDKENQ